MSRPAVGTLAWERAGGPPLTVGQKVAVYGGAAAVILEDLAGRLASRVFPPRPPRVDLSAWDPPDTPSAREAERLLREVSSPAFVWHSLRTYYFAGIMHELSGGRPAIDREALYVAAVLHDVGLFEASRPEREHCFTVGGAREARRIARAAGWDEDRQDRVAVAITSNPNAFVPVETFGPEAHFLRVGGGVEVLAQEWKVHPDNAAEILARYPRDGFAADTRKYVRQEARRNPGCRFACLDPVFPMMVGLMKFSVERA